MTYKRKIIYFLLIIVLAIILFSPKQMHYTTATVGIVSNKSIDDKLTITLLKFKESKENIEEVNIVVENQNLWNLIEVNRSYFISYSWENGSMPVLTEIKIDDQFKEIYGDYFIYERDDERETK